MQVEVLFTPEEIAQRVKELGAEISGSCKDKDLVVVGILKGAVVFMSDLAREIKLPFEMDFMAISSYGQSTETSGVVKLLKDLDTTIEGRDVLIVEDIIDSGLTLSYLYKMLQARKPASIQSVVLLDKPDRRQIDFIPDYIGFKIPDEFVVGYGIDYADKYRGLPYVGIING